MNPWFWLFIVSVGMQVIGFLIIFKEPSRRQQEEDWKRLVVGEIVSISVSNRLNEGVIGTVQFRDVGYRMHVQGFRPETSTREKP